jgi:hypothetical protein
MRLQYGAGDFPELQSLGRQDATQVINEAIAAQRHDGEISAYNSAITGRGVLKIFCLVVALAALVVALEVIPVALGMDPKYLRYLRYSLIILLVPIRIYGKARGKRRLQPYIVAALNRRNAHASIV